MLSRLFWWILCLFLLNAPNISAQPAPLRVCTLQPAEGFGSSVPGAALGWGGYQARALATELSTRKLLDGTTILGVAIVQKTRKDSEAEAKRQGCPYIVELWWHESVDDVDTNSPAGIPSPKPRGNLMGDSTVIEYAMSGSDVHRVIARGSAPPGVIYRTGRHTTPYPLFANQIVAKLNRLQPR
jgi:hypothetical protein